MFTIYTNPSIRYLQDISDRSVRGVPVETNTSIIKFPFGKILNRPPVISTVSLNHVMIGSGFPVTTHVIMTDWPSATRNSGGGGTIMVGASSRNNQNKANCTVFSFVYNIFSKPLNLGLLWPLNLASGPPIFPSDPHCCQAGHNIFTYKASYDLNKCYKKIPD